jgi:hypothetical protein
VKGVEPVGGWHAVVERAGGAAEFGEFEGGLVVADAAVSHAEPAEHVAGHVAELAELAELAGLVVDVEQVPAVEAGVERVAVSEGEVEQQFEEKTEQFAEGTNAVAVADVVCAAAAAAVAPLVEPPVPV